MWEKLNLKRVYTKPKGRQPDYSAPVVLRANRCTVEDFVSYPQSDPIEKGTSLRKRSQARPPYLDSLRHEQYSGPRLTSVLHNHSAMPFTAASSNSSSQPSCMASR